MEIFYQREINYLAEAADMIMRSRGQNTKRVDLSDILSVIEKQSQVRHFDEEKQEQLMKLGRLIQEVAIHGMHTVQMLPEDQLNFYFRPVFECGFSVSAMICETISYLQRMNKAYAELDEGQRNALTLSLLDYISNYSEVDFKAAPSFISEAVDSALGSDSEKWQFTRILDQMDFHIDRLQALVSPVIRALQEKEEIIQQLYDNCISFMKEKIDRQGTAYLKINSNFSIKRSTDIIIEPRVMRFREVASYNTDRQQIVQLGVAVIELDGSYEELGRDKLAETCKAMGDKRRMEILMLLKERSYYGQELAEKLSLTPATISHHMDILVAQRLILVEQSGTKLLYNLAKPYIETVLATLREKLIKE